MEAEGHRDNAEVVGDVLAHSEERRPAKVRKGRNVSVPPVPWDARFAATSDGPQSTMAAIEGSLAAQRQWRQQREKNEQERKQRREAYQIQRAKKKGRT